MCGARMNIEKRLLNRPDIISIGLVWDTDHPSLTFIRNVYQLIGTNIRLNEVILFDTKKKIIINQNFNDLFFIIFFQI